MQIYNHDKTVAQQRAAQAVVGRGRDCRPQLLGRVVSYTNEVKENLLGPEP